MTHISAWTRKRKMHARGARAGRKRLGSHVVETNAKALIEVLRIIPGPRAKAQAESRTTANRGVMERGDVIAA